MLYHYVCTHYIKFIVLYFYLFTTGLIAGIRTDSPDNDSAFSDTVSMLSSESSASSSGSGHKPPQTAIHTAPQQQSHQLVGESLILLFSAVLSMLHYIDDRVLVMH